MTDWGTLTQTPSLSELDGFKMKFKQKSHHPLCAPQNDHLYGSRMIHVPAVDYDSSIVVGDRGRKRFEPRHSHAEEEKPHKRPISRPICKEEVHRGKRYIPLPKAQDEHLSSKKLLPTLSMKRSDTTDNLSLNWKSRGKVVDPETGVSAKFKESEIYNLEATMNRKQRVSTDDLQHRNYIPEATPGDKPLKRADHTPGYYAEGGLIPGSTIQEKKSTNPMANKSTLQMSKSSKKLEPTYEIMQQKLQMQYERSQVESLTVRPFCIFFSFLFLFLLPRILLLNKGNTYLPGKKKQDVSWFLLTTKPFNVESLIFTRRKKKKENWTVQRRLLYKRPRCRKKFTDTTK
jgi:hypothetical protein